MHRQRAGARATNIDRIEQVGLLMLLVLHTVFTLLLFLRIYRFPDWEVWVVPICAVVDIAIWYTYQRQLISNRTMIKIVIITSYAYIFFYGIHPDVFFEMHFIYVAFVIVCSQLDDYGLTKIGFLTYAATLLYHIAVTGEAIRVMREGNSDLHALILTLLVIGPIFMRYSISLHHDERMMRDLEIERTRRKLTDMTEFTSASVGTLLDLTSEAQRNAAAAAASASGEARRSAESAAEAAHDAAWLAYEVKSMADLMLGRIEPHRRSIAMSELTAALIDRFEPCRAGTDVEIIYDISPDMPSQVNTDPYLLTEAARAIVHNAASVSTKGAVCVHISSRQVDDAANLMISVEDTGSQFSATAIEQAYIDDIPRVAPGSMSIAITAAIHTAPLFGATVSISASPSRGNTVSLCASSAVDDASPWLDTSAVKGSACVLFDPTQRSTDGSRWFSLMIEHAARSLDIDIYVARSTAEAAQAVADHDAEVVIASADAIASYPELRSSLTGAARLRPLDGPVSVVSIERALTSGADEPRIELTLIERLRALGADTEKGLVYCAGSEELYRELAMTFAAKAAERAAELGALLDSGDTARYRISIHALKSNLRSLAFDALADMAQRLEAEADKAGPASLRAGHDELMRSMINIGRELTDGYTDAE